MNTKQRVEEYLERITEKLNICGFSDINRLQGRHEINTLITRVIQRTELLQNNTP